METKEFVKKELEKASLYLDEKTIKILVPMYKQWCNYIREARLAAIDNEEPAHIFNLNKGEKTEFLSCNTRQESYERD